MTKPRTMPVHDGSRSDQYERLPPAGPARSQRNPEQLVQGRQSTARSLRVQSQQLLTKSEVFNDEVLPGTKNADHPPEEVPVRDVHARILSENSESCLAPSHLFCGCTAYLRATGQKKIVDAAKIAHLCSQGHSWRETTEETGTAKELP